MRLVVIGHGMVGARFVEEVIAHDAAGKYAITVLGAEDCEPYNRVLLSDVVAGRTHEEALGLGVPVWSRDEIYNAGAQQILHEVLTVPEGYNAVLVIGHAPAIPSLTADLTWVTSHKEADDIQCWFPTAAYSRFTLDGSWASIAEDTTVRLDEMRRIGY